MTFLARLGRIFRCCFLMLMLLTACRGVSSPTATAEVTIARGVTADGITLGGLTLPQAREQLSREFANLPCELVVEAEGQRFALDQTLLGPALDLEKTVALAQTARADENIAVSRTFSPDQAALDACFEEIAKTLDHPPADAKVVSFSYNGGSPVWEFAPAQDGLTLDRADLAAQVQEALENNDFSPIAATLSPASATLTLDMLEQTRQLVATFSTDLLPGTARDTNIELCTKALSGSIVLPGQLFSINQTTGPRTAAAGYKEASTIQQGRLVNARAGGVCQVAGTLYNAAVMADLDIVERHSHSLVSFYIAPALDATLVYGAKDLSFRNNRKTPIYIAGVMDKKARRLTFFVYGEPLPDGMTIRTESRVVALNPPPSGSDEILDNSLSPGTRVVHIKSRQGTVAQSHKVYLDANGKEIKRVALTRDTYPATKLVYRVGPASAAKKPAAGQKPASPPEADTPGDDTPPSDAGPDAPIAQDDSPGQVLNPEESGD